MQEFHKQNNDAHSGDKLLEALSNGILNKVFLQSLSGKDEFESSFFKVSFSCGFVLSGLVETCELCQNTKILHRFLRQRLKTIFELQ